MHGQEERSDPTLRSFTLEEEGGVSDYRGSGARRSSRGFLLLDRETTKEETWGKKQCEALRLFLRRRRGVGGTDAI